MAEIPLTSGRVAIVDDEDYVWLSQWRWCLHWAGTGYARRPTPPAMRPPHRPAGTPPYTQLMHRLIMAAPAGMEVDHIDGDGLNNRRANLRLCGHAENSKNRRPNREGASAFKGVFLASSGRGVWRARIWNGGERVNLGYFGSEEGAARAYDEAARKLHGEFARLNFP